MTLQLEISEEDLALFCRKHGIIKLAIFGSALTDQFNNESDIDVLVEFEPGSVPGFIGLAALENELAGIIGNGRKIDIRTPEDLSRYFREEVIAKAEVLYGEE